MEPRYILAALSVLGITLGLIIMRHRWPWALTVWVCYAVIVSPLLGFVQSGPQIAADRYTYISCMPFAILVGAGVQRLWRVRQGAQSVSTGSIAVLTLIGASLLVLSIMSFRQTRIWHDSRTFLDHIIKLDSGNYVAYYDRGLLKERKGDLAGALRDYSHVIGLDPEHAQAYNNRGVLCNRLGDSAGAMADFNTAIRLAPSSPEAYANRGMIRLSQKDFKRALQDFSKALEVASATWAGRAALKQQVIHIQKQLDIPDPAPHF